MKQVTAAACALCLCLAPSVLSAQEQAFHLEDAIAISLEHNLDIKLLESRLAQSAAAVQIAIGATDLSLGSGISQTRSVYPVDSADVSSYTSYLNGTGTDSTDFSVWLQKQFSFGLGVKTTVAYSRTEQKLWDADKKEWHYANEAYSASGYPSYRGSAQIELTLPLTKSFGNAPVGTDIQIQEAQRRASMQSLQDGISSIVLSTADAYWAYWGACRKLAFYCQSEDHIKSLADDVKRLADSGERAEYEYTQMLAELSSSALDRITGEQEVEQTRAALADVMGIQVSDLVSLGDPADEVPEADSGTGVSIDAEKAVRDAESRRADLLALQEKVAAAGFLVRQAEISALPDCNINLAFGYKGLYYGDSPDKIFIDAYTSNVIGPDFAGGLSFSVDFGPKNEGNIKAAEEQRNQAVLQVQKLRQQIEYDVRTQADGIGKALQILQQSYKTMQYYSATAEGEAKKMSAGYSTVTELASMQDKQISSSVRYIESVRLFVNAVLRYKYTTGRLTGAADSHDTIYDIE